MSENMRLTAVFNALEVLIVTENVNEAKQANESIIKTLHTLTR